MEGMDSSIEQNETKEVLLRRKVSSLRVVRNDTTFYFQQKLWPLKGRITKKTQNLWKFGGGDVSWLKVFNNINVWSDLKVGEELI